MNITHVECLDFPEDILAAIFSRQEELEHKYLEVERRNGTGYGILNGQPFHIDTHRGQALVKDMLWRVTEELTEASEAYDSAEHWDQHAMEEVIDALHFQVALMILLEIDHSEIVDMKTPIEWGVGCQPSNSAAEMIYNVVQALGLAGNKLKMKPWKQSAMFTDVDALKTYVKQAYQALISLCGYIGMDDQDIYNIYYRKSEVNQFRIRSNY